MQPIKPPKHRNNNGLKKIMDLWPFLSPYQRSMLTIRALGMWASAQLCFPKPLHPRHLVLPVLFAQIVVFLIAVNLPANQALTFGTVANLCIVALAISPSIKQTKQV